MEQEIAESIYAVDCNGMIPIHRAALSGDLERVKTLLSIDSTTKHTRHMTKHFWTPLMIAAERGHIKVVEHLLKVDPSRCSIDWSDLDGGTAMYHAISNNQRAVVELLSKYEAEIKTEKKDEVLIEMIKYGGSKSVELLFESIDDTFAKKLIFRPQKSGDTPLIIAVKLNNARAVHALLNKLARLGIDGEEIAEYINNIGSDKNNALIIASDNGATEIVRLLLQPNLIPFIDFNHKDFRGNTPLLAAASHWNPEIVALLLEHNPDPNQVYQTDTEGRTPLILAACAKHLELTRSLVTYDSSSPHLDHQDKSESSALSYVLTPRRKFTEIGKFLVTQSVRNGTLHFKNEKDMSILIYASAAGWNESVKQIVETNPSREYLNYADADGNTALLHACRKGSIQIIKLLIDAGADIEHRNKNGEDAADVAKKEPIRELLLDYQASSATKKAKGAM